jgi:hypothetical protein
MLCRIELALGFPSSSKAAPHARQSLHVLAIAEWTPIAGSSFLLLSDRWLSDHLLSSIFCGGSAVLRG